jgi:CheY-like chemotaxis protein
MSDDQTNKRTILIVDDEEDLAYLTAHHLRLSNFDTITAVNGKEALEKLAKSKVDLVLSDIRMPKMDGITLLSKIIELYGETIPVVLLTGFSEVDHQTALDKGAKVLLNKPVDIDEVERIVKRLTGL